MIIFDEARAYADILMMIRADPSLPPITMNDPAQQTIVTDQTMLFITPDSSDVDYTSPDSVQSIKFRIWILVRDQSALGRLARLAEIGHKLRKLITFATLSHANIPAQSFAGQIKYERRQHPEGLASVACQVAWFPDSEVS